MAIPMDWEKLKEDKRKISILVDNPLPEYKGKGKESYVGYVIDFKDDFLFLKTPDNNRISGICIKSSLILSIWIYKE